jgi:hypothetical protein
MFLLCNQAVASWIPFSTSLPIKKSLSYPDWYESPSGIFFCFVDGLAPQSGATGTFFPFGECVHRRRPVPTLFAGKASDTPRSGQRPDPSERKKFL